MKTCKRARREYKERIKPAGVFMVENHANGKVLEELGLLEEIWLEKLHPFGEQGYKTDSKIRQA